jgi:hypothetical protein
MIEKINDILSEYLEKIKDFKNISYFNINTWFEIVDKISYEININDLNIEPIIHPIDKLKLLRYKQSNNIWNYGNIYLNDKYQNKICTNVKKITFYSLYPNLIIRLADNDIIKFNNNKYYLFFKYLYTNRAKFKEYNTYIMVKIMINYFYGILSGESLQYFKNEKLINCQNFENFDIYKYGIYGNILNKLGDNLIYLDTDEFYYKGDYEFNFNLLFEIEDIDQLLIFQKKRYVEICNGTTKIKGFKTLT